MSGWEMAAMRADAEADQGTDQGCPRVQRVRPMRDPDDSTNHSAGAAIGRQRGTPGRNRLVWPFAVVSQSSEVETNVQRN